VVKLYTTLRIADNHVAYYHPGVGTMGDPSVRYAIPRFWSKVKGLAFGAGFQKNVLDAYRYLMEVYNDGDEIYLFGFSRGAYTARALAGMLHGCGLLCRGNEGHLVYAWKMFHEEAKRSRKLLKKAKMKRGSEKGHSIKRNKSFAETYSRTVTIRFMGLWDTVSSVGWIYSPLLLLDMAQNPIVQVGRHAVSIDERRAYYRDNLWGPAFRIDDEQWPEEFREKGIAQDIAQVWFPGVHSDVGGSYRQCEASPANEALEWMINELQQQGAELCQERIDMVLGKAESGHYDAELIYVPPPEEDHCLHESLTWRWWLLQLFPQQYYDKEDEQIHWRVPYGAARSIPHNSIIYKSAERRLRSTTPGEEVYRPRNLKVEDLTPVNGQVLGTTANLSECFVYSAQRDRALRADSDPVRYTKLVVGWITFGLFWVIILGVAWYALGIVVWFLGIILSWMIITPGLSRLLFP